MLIDACSPQDVEGRTCKVEDIQTQQHIDYAQVSVQVAGTRHEATIFYLLFLCFGIVCL